MQIERSSVWLGFKPLSLAAVWSWFVHKQFLLYYLLCVYSPVFLFLSQVLWLSDDATPTTPSPRPQPSGSGSGQGITSELSPGNLAKPQSERPQHTTPDPEFASEVKLKRTAHLTSWHTGLQQITMVVVAVFKVYSVCKNGIKWWKMVLLASLGKDPSKVQKRDQEKFRYWIKMLQPVLIRVVDWQCSVLIDMSLSLLVLATGSAAYPPGGGPKPDSKRQLHGGHGERQERPIRQDPCGWHHLPQPHHQREPQSHLERALWGNSRVSRTLGSMDQLFKSSPHTYGSYCDDMLWKAIDIIFYQPHSSMKPCAVLKQKVVKLSKL